jgi:hypothetical protein
MDGRAAAAVGAAGSRKDGGGTAAVGATASRTEGSAGAIGAAVSGTFFGGGGGGRCDRGSRFQNGWRGGRCDRDSRLHKGRRGGIQSGVRCSQSYVFLHVLPSPVPRLNVSVPCLALEESYTIGKTRETSSTLCDSLL